MPITGRIIKGISGFYYVCDEHSRIFECKAKGSFRNEAIKPLVGDYVEIEVLDEEKMLGNLVSIYNRKNTLLRPPVSNIDKALIVFAIKSPLPSFNLLDKLLIYYNIQNIPVTVCFNKIDLVTEEDIELVKDIYKESSIGLVFSSFRNNEGLDQIRNILKGSTTVVTGPSGVGKSTLINALIPNADMTTGEISKKLGRGKNTTRHTELFNLDQDTFILDTPGFTSFDLEDVKAEELKQYLPEFVSFSEECRFLDCNHIGETECGVKNALNCGKIHSIRYENYKLIFNDLKNRNNRR